MGNIQNEGQGAPAENTAETVRNTVEMKPNRTAYEAGGKKKYFTVNPNIVGKIAAAGTIIGSAAIGALAGEFIDAAFFEGSHNGWIPGGIIGYYRGVTSAVGDHFYKLRRIKDPGTYGRAKELAVKFNKYMSKRYRKKMLREDSENLMS